MTPNDFAKHHLPALMQQEIRHNLLIAQLLRMQSDRMSQAQTWTLGAPGQCAIMMPGKPIIFGELSETQCAELADLCKNLDYTATVGPDLTAQWYAARAQTNGHFFSAIVPQRIYSITTPPLFRNIIGHARLASTEDIDLLQTWLTAFAQEATFDAPPQRAQIAAMIAEQRHLIWMADSIPVSMAAINRRTPNSAAIGAVYTPPEHRQKGFAGAVTAAVVERIYKEGRSSACLYTDLRNPHSNRCYIKIGFKPECDSMNYARVSSTA